MKEDITMLLSSHTGADWHETYNLRHMILDHIDDFERAIPDKASGTTAERLEQIVDMIEDKAVSLVARIEILSGNDAAHLIYQYEQLSDRLMDSASNDWYVASRLACYDGDTYNHNGLIYDGSATAQDIISAMLG